MNPIHTSRRGSMLVMVAVVMVIFLIGAALCVDIAYMHMVRAELRTACDASSRAGTSELTRTQDPNAGINRALQFAQANTVAGQGLTLNRNEIQLGFAEADGNGRIVFDPGGTQLNSVQVVGRRDAGSADGTVNLFFGDIFGTPDFSPAAAAVSAASVRDIALVMDRSGSMSFPIGLGSNEPRRTALVAALNAFVTEIENVSPTARISLSTYATGATRDIPLTDDFSQIRAGINSMVPSGFTNINGGIQQGIASLETDPNRRRFAERTIVVMTDGRFNNGTPDPRFAAAEAAALGHQVHAVTFSFEARQDTMREVARVGNEGVFLHADTAGDLTEAFREIARTLRVVTID